MNSSILRARITETQSKHNHWYKFPQDHEYEWERVQRRREEGKCLGGQYRHWEKPVLIMEEALCSRL